MAAPKDSANLTHSQIHGGDFVFDFCCTPCDKRKLNREATKYCVNCSEYFCVQCVESHKNFKALSGHVLIDPNSTTPPLSRLSRKFNATPTELCRKHHLKLVDMYCVEEDVVGCSACFLLDHKSCSDIHYIPEYIQSAFPTEQVSQVNNELTRATEVMRKLMTEHDELNVNLHESKWSCKREVQKYRKEINHIIDRIEETTLAELDARHKDATKTMDDMYQNIHNLHNEMVRLESEIESDQSNDGQKFVSAKLSQCVIMQGQELQSELSHDQTTELKFRRNSDIMTFLLNTVTFGTLSPQVMQDSVLSSDDPSGKQQQQTTSTVDMKPQEQSIYKIVDKSEYNMKQPDDKQTCDMWSSCFLDNDNILFADHFNKKLKLVDRKTYAIRSSLTFDASPWSVCRVSGKEAAVCLDNETIQFVSVHDNKLISLRSLSMKHECSCITVIRDKMYLCDNYSLYIYTLNGKLLQTIREDKSSGNNIFSYIYDITVSDDEKMVHVTDMDNGVITLNINGNVVWRYSGTELCTAHGLCTDGNGCVIVCGYRSENVIQLSPDGQYMGEIVTHSDGVTRPRTVSYDRDTHKLIIGKYEGSAITVYTVQ